MESPGAVLELYVDGYYVETPANFNGEVALEAGPHVIEIRAPGYETLHLDVNITPDRLIPYRGSLTPASVPPPLDPTVQSLRMSLPEHRRPSTSSRAVMRATCRRRTRGCPPPGTKLGLSPLRISAQTVACHFLALMI